MKVLKNKTFNIAKSSKYGEYQRGLASMVYKVFGKKFRVSGTTNKIKQNQHPLDLVTRQLAEERHKPIIRKI